MDLPRLTGTEGFEGFCGYGSCQKPLFEPKLNFCGPLHRDLHMAEMFEKLHVDVAQPLQHLYERGVLCNLPGCLKSKFVKSSAGDTFDFCGKLHAFKYMEVKTRQWKEEGRLCQLVDCASHVYVENSSRIHEYCSTKHAALAARARGMSPAVEPRVERVAAPVDEAILRRGYNSFKTRNELAIVNELALQVLESLRAGPIDGTAFDGGPTRHFKIGVNILDFHPWEIVDAEIHMPRYFLSVGEEIQASSQLTTKDGYHWKQDGPLEPYDLDQGSLHKHYFKYERLDERTKRKNAPCQNDQREVKGIWKLHRLTTQSTTPEGSGSRCLFVIWKIFQNTKKRKERRDGLNPVSVEGREFEGVTQEASKLGNPSSSGAAPPVPRSSFEEGRHPHQPADDTQRDSEEQECPSLGGTSSLDPQMDFTVIQEREESNIVMTEAADSLELSLAQDGMALPWIDVDKNLQLSLGLSDEQSTQGLQGQQAPPPSPILSTLESILDLQALRDHDHDLDQDPNIYLFSSDDPSKVFSPPPHCLHETSTDCYSMDSD